MYRLLGKHMYASEGTLHLIGAPALRGLVREVKPKDASVRLHCVRWLGFACNLVLVVQKSA
jgi:hypothetical protein